MQKYIVVIIVCASFFLAGIGFGADGKNEQSSGKTEQGIASYTDRELQLAFENCQLRIQTAQQQIIDARNLMQQLQAEAKKRQDKAKSGAKDKPAEKPKVGTDAPEKGTTQKP